MSEEKKKKCDEDSCDCQDKDKECHGHKHKHNHNHTQENDCHCGDGHCDCGDDCHCGDDCCSGNGECHCGCGDEPKVNEINLDYLDIAQRLKAEFDNYKRRNENLKQQSYLDGMGDTIVKLLPVLDGFDQAIKSITDSNVVSGVEMIRKQMSNILESMGVKKIDCVGKAFDPNLHNAVYAESVEGKEKDTVLDEFQAGYTLNGKVLRHSVVKISK